ncbi:uncharacterized protein [Nicotiana sylvestris]|uniref:uncharacterized protein n=1 Tax=Nicotiana sylvestris TaxID=4096 RepID=UPI00388CA9E9
MVNQVIIGALFQEGTSQVRPPYFNGQYFSHWKVHMEIYAKAYDVKVWRVIKKGNYSLPAATPPLADPEDIDLYTKEQMEVVQVNNKARNLLYNAISGEEYEKISSCGTTKEMWDKLDITYEGTSKAKETHINMLVHDYELFSMKEGEFIEEIFARFRKIISDLKDLNKLSYDELQGELRDFEKTHLKKTSQEEKRKIVAFKASTEIAETEIDDDPEALQEEIAMLSRNMDGSMRRFRNTRKGRIPPRGFNKNKSFGSWSDEDSSEHEEIANLCFMTILENEMNKSSGCWTDEDTSDDKYNDDNENYFMTRGETIEEHHRISRKGKWYLDSACSSHITCDKNQFKEVTKIDGGSVKFGDNSRGKIIGTGTIAFNNNCDITEVYLVDGLNYNLLSISQLYDSGYEVNLKKTGCAIEDETGKTILPEKRYRNVYILDGFEKIDGHICLISMSDYPWL